MHILSDPASLLTLPGLLQGGSCSAAGTLESTPGTGCCVTIGNFDGVHLGHRTLIQTMLAKARRLKVPGVVVTFWPHPLAVLAGKHAPPLITSQADRRALMRCLGVDVLLELPFDRQIAALTPEEFVRAELLPLGCRHLVIGYDFSLGKGRAGNRQVLESLGRQYGFEVEQLAPVIVNDAVVSSTRVRDLVRAGDMWELQAVLGRHYHLSGVVEKGHARGRELGFPTANIHTGNVLLPKNGVYATWVEGTDKENGGPWPGVTNVGTAPTFGNAVASVETFLLAGGGDLYGRELQVRFVQRLRDEQKFESLDALKARIARDVDLARQVLAHNGSPGE